MQRTCSRTLVIVSSDDELVTIDHFLNVAHAELARGALEASDIETILDVGIHGDVRLQVQRRDAPLAAAILTGEHLRGEEMATPGDSYLPRRPVVCRRCGSEEVYRVQDRHKAFAMAFVIVLLGMMVIPLADWLLPLAGVGVPHDAMRIAFVALIVVPLFIALAAVLSRKVRCRNCGLEWHSS